MKYTISEWPERVGTTVTVYDESGHLVSTYPCLTSPEIKRLKKQIASGAFKPEVQR